MSEKSLTIGALARLTRTNPAIIREYERLGLLGSASRTSVASDANGHRTYDEADARRLTFLRRCRDLGLLNPRLLQLTELIDHPDHPRDETIAFASTFLGNVREQLAELGELVSALEALTGRAGAEALNSISVDTAPIDSVKRMRRQVRKPLKTPPNT